MLGSSQEAEYGGYRTHASPAAHYGGQYGAMYGTSNLSSGQKVGRADYGSAQGESPKFASGALGSSLGLQNDDYVYVSSSNHGYGHKGDQFPAAKVSDYATTDSHHYGEHQRTYSGRDIQSESARRYTDSVGLGHQRQSEMHDHVDQASLA